MSKKILVIAGGGIKHLAPFAKEGKKLGLDVTLSSLSELEFWTKEGGEKIDLTLATGERILDFGVIYIRLVGRHTEEMSVLSDFCRKNGIKVVDSNLASGFYARLPIIKSLETKLLVEAGIPVPKTFSGSLARIRQKAIEMGFPVVIKLTTGKQGHGVWSPRNEKELVALINKLSAQEKIGKRFVVQEFIESSQRFRVLVVGSRAIAMIARPTRWRKRFNRKVLSQNLSGAIYPIPEIDAKLAVKAAQVLGIEVGGADIIRSDKTGKAYVLEVNSAPRWAAVTGDTGINVEAEILKYLASIANGV